MNIPGRSCPIDYNIDKNIFSDSTKDVDCDCLYVVGGLYGNLQSLNEIIEMANSENLPTTIVFNGDIHWFDIHPDDFEKIEGIIKNHMPLLGNVEAEIIRSEDINVGCGCSYPDCVDDEAVERSNEIHRMLKQGALKSRVSIDNLKSRSYACTAKVGDKRIAITHGDEISLAGWGCSRENLFESSRQLDLEKWFKDNSIDIIASTHTCAPAVFSKNSKAVINNGASGMPNFSNTNYGLITRISKNKNERAIYRSKLDDIYIEAVPINYDSNKFITWFDSVWDSDSPAAISYRDRIVSGGCDSPKDALICGFELLI